MKKLFLLIIFVGSALQVLAQSTMIPYNREYYHLIDR
ncbi:MAG: hypothetical protein ACI9Z3_002322, partial [Roseivirga sp.]